MKTLGFAILFAAIGSSVVNADMKIGVVNFERAAQLEAEVQKAMVDFEKKDRAQAEKDKKTRQDLEKMMAEFQKKMPALNDEARQAEQTRIGEQVQKAQTQSEAAHQQIAQERQAAINDFENKNRLKLESIGKKGGFDFILNAIVAPYISPELKKNDVTDLLAAEYNKDYPVKAEPVKKAPEKKGASAPKK